MLISMDKKYRTKEGNPVRILCVDRINSTYPVTALVLENKNEYFRAYTEDGKHNVSRENHYLNLVEVNEYDDFKIDEPVMMRMKNGANWHRRHFAGVDNGKPKAWSNECTSWTSNISCVWDRCRRPTKEELNS